jgi:hypothetical protein
MEFRRYLLQNTNANYSAFFSTYSTNNNNIDFSTQAGVTNEQFSQQVVRVSASDLIASETNVDQAANRKYVFRLKQDFDFMYKNL